MTLTQARDWVSRGTALDSTFIVPYYHLFDLALRTGNTTETAQATRRLAALSTGDVAVYYRLIASVLETQPISTSARALLDSVPVRFAASLLQALASMPDSGDVALTLAQSVAARPLPRLATDPDTAGVRDAMALPFALRGRGRDALTWSKAPGLQLQLSRIGIVSPDSALTRMRQLLAQDPRQAVGASRLFAEVHDTASLRRLTVYADSVDKATTSPTGKTAPSALMALPAFRLLAASDTNGAVKSFLAIPMSACGGLPCAASTVAALLVKRARPAEAARVLDRWLPSQSRRIDVPLDWLARARIAEQMGDTEKAALFYRRVVAVWRGGDAELQERVNEAKAGVGRMSRK